MSNRTNYFLGSILILLILIFFDMATNAESLIIIILSLIFWELGEINFNISKKNKRRKK